MSWLSDALGGRSSAEKSSAKRRAAQAAAKKKAAEQKRKAKAAADAARRQAAAQKAQLAAQQKQYQQQAARVQQQFGQQLKTVETGIREGIMGLDQGETRMPSETDPEVMKAAERVRKRARGRSGRASTILTG